MNDRYTAHEIFTFCQENWPEAYNPIHQYAIYFHRLRDIVVIKAHETMKEAGLSGAEFDILATLRRSTYPHILKPTELQRSALISSGGLTKLLYQLEVRSLISRSIKQEDKRSKLVHLTSKGKELIETTMDTLAAQEKKRLDKAMSESERDQLIKSLSKLLNVLEN